MKRKMILCTLLAAMLLTACTPGVQTPGTSGAVPGETTDPVPSVTSSEPMQDFPELTLPSDILPPETTVPQLTEPDETEPTETEPEVTEPEETGPEKTEPEETEPEVTEPPASEPEATRDPNELPEVPI